MPDDSPYRVKVMRLTDLKLDDEAPTVQPVESTADTPAVNTDARAAQPTPSAAGAAVVHTPPPAEIASDEAVIIDEHIIGPAPQPRETPPTVSVSMEPTPLVSLATESDGGAPLPSKKVLSLNVPDDLPSVEEASRKHALRPIIPLEPEEPIVVPKVFAPIARKAALNPIPTPTPQRVRVEPTLEPLGVSTATAASPATGPGDVQPSTTSSFIPQEPPLPQPIAPPTTTPTPTAWVPTAPAPATVAQPVTPQPTPLSPSSGGINLNALRERVLHESTNPTFHAQVKSIHTEAHTEGLAELRKAKLAGANLHELRNLVHDHETVSHPGPTSHQPTESKLSEKPFVEHMLLAKTGPRDTPPSTPHAAGIATIASELHTLQNNVTPPRKDEGLPLTSTSPGAGMGTVPALRTFRSDVERTIMHNQTSVVKAISAEEMRRSEESARIIEGRRATFTPTAYILLGTSIILILMGLGGVGAYFLFTQDALPLPDSGVSTFFFTEAQSVFDITGRSRTDILEGLTATKEQADVTVRAITQIHLTETQTVGTAPTLAMVTGADFLKRIEARTPDKLLRELAPAMMLGVHEVEGNQIFLILKTNYFENAFLGMLEWERNINLDLAPLFGPVVEEVVMRESSSPHNPEASGSVDAPQATTTATTTASTTPEATPEPGWNRYGFVDMIINNKEVRALKNDAGEVALLWSFADQNTIIITTSRKTLEEVLTRLNARRYD